MQLESLKEKVPKEEGMISEDHRVRIETSLEKETIVCRLLEDMQHT
jgi:hypothetical protein